MFKDGLDYWKQVVKDYISCYCGDDYDNLTEKEQNEVAERVFTDDELWNQIDEIILYHLTKYQKRSKEELPF